MMDDRPLRAANESLPRPSSRLAGIAQPRSPIETVKRSWRRWALVLLLPAFIGFVGWWHIIRPVRRNIQLRLSLTSFALLYQAYQRDLGRSPQNIDDLETFVRAQATGKRASECSSAQTALEMARDGRLHVVWNAWRIWGGNDYYLARESKVPADGGFVLWTNTSIEYFSAAEYSRRPPQPIQTMDKP